MVRYLILSLLLCARAHAGVCADDLSHLAPKAAILDWATERIYFSVREAFDYPEATIDLFKRRDLIEWQEEIDEMNIRTLDRVSERNKWIDVTASFPDAPLIFKLMPAWRNENCLSTAAQICRIGRQDTLATEYYYRVAGFVRVANFAEADVGLVVQKKDQSTIHAFLPIHGTPFILHKPGLQYPIAIEHINNGLSFYEKTNKTEVRYYRAPP